MVDKSLPTTTKRSLILKYISRDLYLELYKITMIADANNNEKGALIKDALNRFNVPFDSLGSGTNRMAVLIDGYAVKIALDKGIEQHAEHIGQTIGRHFGIVEHGIDILGQIELAVDDTLPAIGVR